MSLGGERQPWDAGAQTARLWGGGGSSTQSNGERSRDFHFPGAHPVPVSTRPPHPVVLHSFLTVPASYLEPPPTPPQSTLTHTGLQQPEEPQPPGQEGLLQASQAGGSRGAGGAPSSRATLTALALVGDFITQSVQGPNHGGIQ